MSVRRPNVLGFATKAEAGFSDNRSVAVYGLREHARSKAVCSAVLEGLTRAKYRPQFFYEDEYSQPVCNMAVFYGYVQNMPRIMRDYPTAVYVDLGYWNRKQTGKYKGYHKIAVNDRHPTNHFMNKPVDYDRLYEMGIEIQPWRKRGDDIVVAGMSAKAARAAGYAPGSWESQAIQELRQHTDRRIIYRPKPNCRFSKPIEGAEYQKTQSPIQETLNNCHALVTHHSNCAVDALIHGVPVFVKEGVALPMALTDLAMIESPLYPGDRKQWAAAVAYCQWTLDEMRTPAPWVFLKRQRAI